mmetsp:Transcript_9213/g.13797  ORF Transcript_9213/g.13797 Transcript_9213/m.13797 type:complete len:383 (-) Transcript_9213:378-1526(-)|eukprot:CAMPEP_0194115696 /NCGR_PEP_ID=MMETSP0150-20130528/24339_1 /TAXON_ID=122233 /ORGANISM="Chaetoceros debilis, Strain MM31A-1" /LENGTH=382 /DNA_ID=CAMNT_0038806235 /DNA_START=234 /DNA_END=1382 /DNA_ORIENTATION=-
MATETIASTFPVCIPTSSSSSLGHSDETTTTTSCTSMDLDNNNTRLIIQKINDVHDMCTHLLRDGKLPTGTSSDTVMVEYESEYETRSPEMNSILDQSRSESMPHNHNHKQGINTVNQSTSITPAEPIFGVVVNGFHPQLSAWQKNQTDMHLKGQRELEDKIYDVVESCRKEENASIVQAQNNRAAMQASRDSESEVPAQRFSSDMTVEELFSDIFEKSKVPQVIATPGGRFGAWNKEFLETCGFAPSGPYASLTLFDLVMPHALPMLHQIFLTSLYEQFPSDSNSNMNAATSSSSNSNSYFVASTYNETESKSDSIPDSYLSLTVPCIQFKKGQEKHFITLSLMYDRNPDKRCFHCILSNQPTSNVGKIFYIERDELLGML